MIYIKSLLRTLLKSALLLALFGAVVILGAYLYLKPGLPDVQSLREVQLQTPLRIYSSDDKLIAEYGEKRRSPIRYEQIPPLFIEAILAAEDSRFKEHHGVDIKGLIRAAVQLASTGKIQSGGSTITMQVAKNYFLTRDRTFIRKFNEILLALEIEQELSKAEILELYLNKIYLGNRAYGIQAAANAYYGLNIDQLDLPQLAMIAGLPKAPSAYNPLANPTRAIERRNWIMQRMQVLGYIDTETLQQALDAPVSAQYYGSDIEIQAPYVAEMVRSQLQSQYGDNIYTDGINAYTTIDSQQQLAANLAVENGLIAYDERHGYRGAEQQLGISGSDEKRLAALQETPSFGPLKPALVTDLGPNTTTARLKNGEQILIEWEGLEWARRFISINTRGPRPGQSSDILALGDLIRVRQNEEGHWYLAQLPEVQGALVALSPGNGAIQALVGGFNFHHSKFNRVTQATRQPGSNFKPFIYTTALASGLTPATVINDAPVVFEDSKLESGWRPENYSKKFYGPTRLREALYKSRNLVSIRILKRIGVKPALEYIKRFGFETTRLPDNLSLALGSADVTPLELVSAYAILANGGHKVSPFFLQRVESFDGDILFEADPVTVCEGCVLIDPAALPPTEQTDGRQLTAHPIAPRIIDERTAYLINNIMQDVIKRGTGKRAQQLGRTDLAGKTGTTNDQKDAWFSGFNRQLVTSTWVGFDQPESLGRREFGSTAALPIWIDFMQQALKNTPIDLPPPPEGIVSVRIDPQSGLLAYPGQEDAIFEIFREENAPKEVALSGKTSTERISTEELF
jgi:penicillin-binding protein 1A